MYCTTMHFTNDTNPIYLHTETILRHETYNFDPSTTNPLDVAGRDHLDYFVQKVFAHRGNLQFKRNLEFHVRWLNYDESHDSWEPYAALRDTAPLHRYLHLHKLEKLIPQKFKT
jgi:Chromo (CHRromatin Organisation MOdifier) domain